MPKLSDTHLMLLAHAAKQDSGSLYPLPPAMMKDGTLAPRASAAIEQLSGRGLIEERETRARSEIYCTDGDLSFGQYITAIGLAAIGITEGEALGADAVLPAPSQGVARQTKSAMVLALLEREQGASLPELIEATGWLPHTTRAALTGLRKKGHTLEKTTRDGATCYTVAAAA